MEGIAELLVLPDVDSTETSFMVYNKVGVNFGPLSCCGLPRMIGAKIEFGCTPACALSEAPSGGIA